MECASLIPLQSRTIAGGLPGPHLLILGGIHGDEFEPMAAARRLIRELANQDPERLAGRVTMIPVVNEGAFELGRRTGPDGRDLARTFPGRSDGELTERVACAAAEWIRRADFLIDLHTGGTELDVLPLAGYTLHADLPIRRKQEAMARAFNLPVVWGTEAGKSGRTLSVARDAGIPAIYAEYRGAACCRPEGVDAYVDGCLNVMGMLEMIDRPRPENRVEYFVEDPRPDAGHMQVCHPSPITGFFTPSRPLGARIGQGEVFGTVTDVLGDNETPIFADRSGIVLVLRTFPRVRAGETVGVILETP